MKNRKDDQYTPIHKMWATDGFMSNPSMNVSQCFFCKHAKKGKVCDAFPEGIPVEILLNKKDHRNPVDGDHGITFSPIDEKYKDMEFRPLK